jgi:hypothetical protein
VAKSKRKCLICANVITEANERIECPFGTGCKYCEICHRWMETSAFNEGLRMHAEWVKQRNSVGSSA